MPPKKGSHSVVTLAVFLLLTITEELHGADTHTHELHGINSMGCLHDANNDKTNQLKHILPLIYANVQTQQTVNGLVYGLVINNKANFKWICHTDDTLAGNVQYITLYNIQDNLPVYSAYKATPAFAGNPGNPALTRPGWKDPNPSFINNNINNMALPTDADYKLGPASLIDRGHLFAAAYASADQAQFKSTFKITNVVAQDSVFNRKVWSQAERILKAVGMQNCLGMTNAGQSGIPLVVTGAVPKNQNADLLDQPYFSVQPIDPITKQLVAGRRRFKVPVLMWTTMWCMLNNNVQYHVSFIGANGPMGVVKFYHDFNIFQEELAAMYGIINTGIPWQGMTTPVQNKLIDDLLTPEIRKQDGIGWADIHQQIWRSRFRSERINFLETLLYDNLFQMDIPVRSQDIEAVRGGINRKRRSTSQAAVQTNTTFTLVEIKDRDPDSNFRLTECSVVEEINETGKTQTHTIDMDKNKLIDSEDTTGSKITGSFQDEDGKIKAMKKEKSTERTISIVLSPRTP